MRVVRRYARSSGEAEDMAQNALLRAWRHREKLEDPDRLVEWVSRIARNEALRELERRIPEPVEEFELEGEEDQQLVALVNGSTVWNALEDLSEKDREILRLRYEEDLTQSAIAEHLGIPEGTVKVRLFRARAKLRERPGIQ